MGKVVSLIIELDSDLLQEIIEGTQKERLDIIREFPFTITDAIKDGIPYPKGKWINTTEFDEYYGHVYKCSHCGGEVLGCDAKEFCPHCRASMEESIDESN